MRTPKLPAASPARPAHPAHPAALARRLARRLDQHGQDLAWLRIRVLNMEATLSRWPALRRFLRTLPRNLKALNPNFAPFTAECWSRRKPAQTRASAIVAYLRAHPGASASATAHACGLPITVLCRSRLYRDLRLEQTQMPWPARSCEPTGPTARALDYLATHRPRTIADVVRGIGLHRTGLYGSRRFRAAWDAYRRATGLDRAPRPPPRRRSRATSSGVTVTLSSSPPRAGAVPSAAAQRAARAGRRAPRADRRTRR